MSNNNSLPGTRDGLSNDQKNAEANAIAGNTQQATVDVVNVESDNESTAQSTSADDEASVAHPSYSELGIPDSTGDTVDVAVMQIDYTTRERGNSEYPVLHIFGRNPDKDLSEEDNLEHIEIHDFEPYFYVPEGDAVQEVKQDNRVTRTESGYESIRGTTVVRVYTELPKHVGQMKGDLDEHYEADILFPNRFLIDKEIYSGISVPERRKDTDDGKIVVKEQEVEAISVNTTPRVNIFDIEVEDRNGFPEDGEEEIICITSYDNYDDEYVIWVAQPDTDVDLPDSISDYSPIEASELNYRIETFSDEVRMLVAFLDYLERTDPDVLTGWNFEDFDATYLIDRLDVLNDEVGDFDGDGLWRGRLSRLNVCYTSNWGPTIKGRVVMDLLYAYKRTQFSEKESYRLDAIGADELGVGKEHYSGDIGDLWENDPETLLKYNLRDVEICRELNQKQEIIQFWGEVRTFVGCLLEDAPTPSDACDMYVLHKVQGESDSQKPRYVLPSKGQADYEDYEGGAVFDAISGVRENVTVLDLKSLYPMCMVSINASPETKVENPDDYDGETFQSPPIAMGDGEEERIHFKKDEDGVIRDIIDELLSEREQKKTLRNDHDPDSEDYEKFDRQQGAVKVIMNSLYGVLGWERFRLYDKAMGAAVTATGRGVINFTETVVEEENLEVTYGDTDSVMLELGDVDIPNTIMVPPKMKQAHPNMTNDELRTIAACVKLSQNLEETINTRYNDFARNELNINLDNGEEHRFQIEFEKLYRRFFQAGKKKRYAGHIVWKEGKHVDNIDITGFESERSDIASITKEVQIKVLNMICTGADEDEIKDYIHGIIENVQSGNVDIDDIGIPGGIGKKLDNYATPTAQVRGAMYANMLLGTNFGNGSKPKRLYLKKVHPDFWEHARDQLGLNPQANELYAQFKRDPDVICYEYADDIPEEFQIDWDKMLNKTLQSPISRVITAIGLTWEDVKTGQTQTGLSNFM